MTAAKPVNNSRIEEILTRSDLEFQSSDKDELVIPADNATFYWNTSHPQILQLRAQWRGVTQNDQQFRALCDQISLCNRTRTAPKAYLAPLKDHRFGVICENNIVATAGITETQLANFFETAMGFTLAFLHDLENALPEMVTWETSQHRSFIDRASQANNSHHRVQHLEVEKRTLGCSSPQSLNDSAHFAHPFSNAQAQSKTKKAAQNSQEAQHPYLRIATGEECDER